MTEIQIAEIAQYVKEIGELKAGYKLLDLNWAAVHEGAMDPIREAVGDPNATVPEICEKISSLRAAITQHRAQKADDRCIEDDDKLYEALGDGIKCDRRVGDTSAMVANCARFIRQRCEPGGWPSYVELESKIDSLRAIAQELAAKCFRGSRACSACGAIAYMGAAIHNDGCAVTRLEQYR